MVTRAANLVWIARGIGVSEKRRFFSSVHSWCGLSRPIHERVCSAANSSRNDNDGAGSCWDSNNEATVTFSSTRRGSFTRWRNPGTDLGAPFKMSDSAWQPLPTALYKCGRKVRAGRRRRTGGSQQRGTHSMNMASGSRWSRLRPLSREDHQRFLSSQLGPRR
jgi:hypothetical protein